MSDRRSLPTSSPKVSRSQSHSWCLCMQNMTFENVTTVAEHMFVSYSGGLVVAEDTAGAEEDVYTVDYDYESYGSWTSVRDTVAAAPASALEQFPTQRVPLATAGDPWFVALQKVRLSLLAQGMRVTHPGGVSSKWSSGHA